MIRNSTFAILLALCASAVAAVDDPANDADNEPQNDSVTRVKSDAKVVARWTFDAKDELGKWSAKPQVGDAGPRPPVYPDFARSNHAGQFMKGAYLQVADDGETSDLRFSKGESITIESWVRVDELKSGQYAYILGKGRSGKNGFPEKNQNYALRLKGDSKGARISFLFSSAAEKDRPGEWHRWTSKTGFEAGAEWHHVAVSYTFGKGNSVKGYIDGREVQGDWDMGGATNRAPVSDNDDLVLGSGNGHSSGNRLNGWLDQTAIYRGTVPGTELQARFDYVTPPPPVDPKQIRAGKVLVQLCDQGMPDHDGWPLDALKATESYEEEAFGLVRLPYKYVDTGIRGDRGNPLLVRAAANVKLPPGTHRWLIRARTASRLLVDGKSVLNTPFAPKDSGGHGTVNGEDAYLNLGPDFRFAPAGEREAWTSLDLGGGEHFVIFETIVGGFAGKSKRRPELGETVVAISLEGSDTWQLLTPSDRKIPYNDAGWDAYAAERRVFLDKLDAWSRAIVRQEHDGYWNKRREAAQKWLASAKPIKIPALPKGYPANNEVDRFLAKRLAEARKQTPKAAHGGVDYFKDIQPILEARCYDCHRGTKVQGDLRLDTLAGALKGGEGYGPAITPGKPGESALLERAKTTDPDTIMPPKGDRLTDEQIAKLEQWIADGASWPEFKLDHANVTPLTDDLAFLRRVTLDTVGVVPTLEEIRAFQADQSSDKREKVIDRLLADPRWADHWMGYWQDVLAENPNILNPTLNNTGPFRWWIYESLRDDKPMDLFVTELLRMRGSERFGGPAGFATASQNDAPFAAKGTIVSTAFLGIEMKCARCHDAPAHESKQEDLFQLAALLAAKPVEVPKTSSVALDKIIASGRTPLIQVTLKPGSTVEPAWPWPELCDEKVGAELAEDADDPRDRLAALVTAPENQRFAQVIANRVWKRLMGRGIVEPVNDWEQGQPTHPELLAWLGRELVRNDFQLKPMTKTILMSHAYQRATNPDLRETHPLFTAPAPRRLDAEQIVDSLYAATGKRFRLEEVNLDVDGRRALNSSISLGWATRSWMLTSTSNERDRPSLALPRVQAVCDVLQAFGWRGSRQDPASTRDTAPNALQPAILANGTVTTWLTRLSDDHGITQLALEDQSVEELLDSLYLRMLTRLPNADEKVRYLKYLKPGFETRRREAKPSTESQRRPKPYVSWSNHLDPEATVERQREEAAANRGDPPTERLDPEWRERLEDVLWALVNAPEFVFTP
jgi:cytochrome c553